MQSAYCWRYSTETKLLCAYNDLLWALDEGSEALLVLLDLSSAFNTVNHYISLTRLRDRFAITSTVLEWIRSYLTSRSASVRIGTICSSVSTLCNEVPNRFVLGPILFTLYVSPLEDIIRAPDIDCMMYADESQLYTVLQDPQDGTIVRRLEHCITDIKMWSAANKWFLNGGKTEVIHLFSKFRQPSLLIFTGINAGMCHCSGHV